LNDADLLRAGLVLQQSVPAACRFAACAAWTCEGVLADWSQGRSPGRLAQTHARAYTARASPSDAERAHVH
jgi:hypothetical protein